MFDNLESDRYRIFTDCFEESIDIIKNMKILSVAERKMISETAIYFQDMLEYVEFDDIEKDYVKDWIENCIHVLGLEYEQKFILQFHYFEENYANQNKDQVIETLISVLVSLRAISTKYPDLHILKATEFGYLERDLPKIRVFLANLFAKQEYIECPNLLFLLTNLIDTMGPLKGSDVFSSEVKKLLNIISNYYPDLKKLSDISPGSIIHINEIVYKHGLSVSVKDISGNPLRQKAKLFYLLSKLRKGLDVSFDELGNSHDYPRYRYLWWIANSWINKNENNPIGILPVCRRHIDVEFIFNSLWGNVSEIKREKINSDDIEKILNYRDEDIKDRLYDFLIHHPLVTTHSKLSLEDERNKAHGGGEISDFNFEIELGNEKYWIAIPIKSGRESRSSSSEKMKQDYFYQMVRPILEFQNNRVAVFPIILTKKTLNTNEFLSLVRAHLNLPILSINTETCAQILKKSNLLT